MEISAILGAIAGAVIGAMIWAGIAIYTGYEIGWIAWGVGAAVGYGAHALEGRGMTTGIVCALLAALAILGGKVMAINHFVNEELTQIADAGLTEDTYNELNADAAAFASLSSEADYPAFMVEHHFTEAEAPADVAQSDVDEFKTFNVPQLQAWNAAPPSYAEWREKAKADAQSYFADEIPMSELLVDALSPMDLLFFALGVFTAFRVGYGAESAEA